VTISFSRRTLLHGVNQLLHITQKNLKRYKNLTHVMPVSAAMASPDDG